MRSVARAERERRVSEAAELLGLGRLLDRRPAELSGGEQQRVAMARAIVRSPKVFLFDEPLSNLDAKLRAELRVELAALVRRLGTTAMYVTHDQAEAMTMGDRVAVLRKGRLEQVAPPREIYERPASAFVAAFLGTPTMNLIELACSDGVGSAEGIEIVLPPALAGESGLTVGLRPEHLALDRQDAPSGDGRRLNASVAEDTVRIAATVAVVEPLGAETYLHLDAGGTRLRARVAGLDAPEPGEEVTLRIARASLHWFDRATGARLDPPSDGRSMVGG
jgi:multiple sugar transport system ATP-binding protein